MPSGSSAPNPGNSINSTSTTSPAPTIGVVVGVMETSFTRTARNSTTAAFATVHEMTTPKATFIATETFMSITLLRKRLGRCSEEGIRPTKNTSCEPEPREYMPRRKPGQEHLRPESNPKNAYSAFDNPSNTATRSFHDRATEFT